MSHIVPSTTGTINSQEPTCIAPEPKDRFEVAPAVPSTSGVTSPRSQLVSFVLPSVISPITKLKENFL